MRVLAGKEVTIGAHPGPFVDQGQGTVNFNATGLPPVASNVSITATATELVGGAGSNPLNTSEFSQAITNRRQARRRYRPPRQRRRLPPSY